MTTSGAVDLPLQVFGSYCPELPPASLPPGLSPWTQDSEFIRGGVKTRPGLFQQFQVPNNPTINYLKTYITASLVQRLLALDSLGNVYKETPAGTLNTIIGTIAAGSYAKSATCFGREYMAFGDGLNGIDIPRQYDDSNFDRVSQSGPGDAPGVVDETSVYNLANSPTGAIPYFNTTAIVAISEVGYLCTVTCALVPSPAAEGDNVSISGAGVGGYNGTFRIAQIIDSTHFTYVNTVSGLAAAGAAGAIDFGLAEFQSTTATQNFVIGLSVTTAGVGVASYNGTFKIRTVISSTLWTAYIGIFGLVASGGGTATPVGNIPAGVHQLSVLFVTRQGYLTAPAAPPAAWTAVGGKRAACSGIPTGPPNIVARILIFTAAGGANFFYTGPQSPITSGNMIIADNTTVSTAIDFTDPVLLSGINADELFNIIELGECAGVIDYAGRMFWWGERNKVNNVLNFSFDGGFDAYNFPLGWFTASAAGGAGTYTPANVVWGGAYTITGDGVSATRGRLSQGIFQDWRGVPILLPNTAYGVRVRAARNNTLAQGTLAIDASGTGVSPVGLRVTAAQAGISYAEFTSSTFLPATAVLPSDLAIFVSVIGTPTNGGIFYVDNIEIFPINQPFNNHQIRASFNVGSNVNLGPESFDGVSGLLSPQPFDGQAIRCMFKLREFLYIVKERSLYVTQDDGINEPANWSIRQISATVGTPSVNGVAVGEDWAVIANRSGLYMFNGGEPRKISQEIQSNQTDLTLKFYWDNTNWSKGQLLWAVVDALNKRIFVGLPFASDATPTGVFYLDYRPLGDSEEIINGNPLHTSFAGKVINYERSRKWNPWNVIANCAAVIERPDGTGQVFIGSGLANGQIWSLSQSQLYDNLNGVQTAINSFYTPYGFPSHDEEQGLQLGSHKKDFTYLTAYVEGAGLCTVNFYADNPAATAKVLTAWSLDTSTARDREQQLGGGVTAERGFFQFGTNAVGAQFKMQKFVPSLKPSVIPLRGVA